MEDPNPTRTRRPARLRDIASIGVERMEVQPVRTGLAHEGG